MASITAVVEGRVPRLGRRRYPLRQQEGNGTTMAEMAVDPRMLPVSGFEYASAGSRPQH